ncbi:asparaginase [Nocardia sp. NPDC059239]|uniref:asparaginase n=1 Tax=Nocardia sp. NPDC059239 TaxID=3346785 RepID=UPI0036B71BE0
MKHNDTGAVVAVIGTGGSIASIGHNTLDLHEYGDSGSIVDVGELIARCPEVHGVAKVIDVNIGQIGSSHIGPSDWLRFIEVIHSTVADHPELTGIVLTHGTVTLEETAYFLDLAANVDIPIVLVGAQRPLTGLSSDGYINLLNAVRAAASPQCRDLGALVVLNNEIHAARDVTKTSTYSLEAFNSRDLGKLGYVDVDGSVVVYRRPARHHAPGTRFDVEGIPDLPRVDVVYSYAGAGGCAVESAVRAGAEAIVSAGFAPGVVTPAEWDALVDARRSGIVVIQSTRAGGGRVLSSAKLQEAGIVVADNLNPQKSRILAMLALTVTKDVERIQSFFDEY